MNLEDNLSEILKKWGKKAIDILRYINSLDHVSVSDLESNFSVEKQTLRYYLGEFYKKNLIERSKFLENTARSKYFVPFNLKETLENKLNSLNEKKEVHKPTCETVCNFILEYISKHDKKIQKEIKEAGEENNITKSNVYNCLKKLDNENIIEKKRDLKNLNVVYYEIKTKQL